MKLINYFRGDEIPKGECITVTNRGYAFRKDGKIHNSFGYAGFSNMASDISYCLDDQIIIRVDLRREGERYYDFKSIYIKYAEKVGRNIE